MREVFMRSRAVDQLDNVPFCEHQRITDAILELAEDPRPQGCERIIGDIYRLRVGPWSVVYMVHDEGQWVEVGTIRTRWRHEALNHTPDLVG